MTYSRGQSSGSRVAERQFYGLATRTQPIFREGPTGTGRIVSLSPDQSADISWLVSRRDELLKLFHVEHSSAPDSKLFHVKHLASREKSLLHSRCNLGASLGTSHCHCQSKGRCWKDDHSCKSWCLASRL